MAVFKKFSCFGYSDCFCSGFYRHSYAALVSYCSISSTVFSAVGLGSLSRTLLFGELVLNYTFLRLNSV